MLQIVAAKFPLDTGFGRRWAEFDELAKMSPIAVEIVLFDV